MKNKQKTTTILAITILSAFCLFVYLNSKNFHVKFTNRTGENIDSLKIGQTFIGQLKEESTTENIELKDFEFDGSFPYENVSGIINNNKLGPFLWSFCGTERNSKSSGSYHFDVRKVIDNNGKTCLFLAPHNEKMFWD